MSDYQFLTVDREDHIGIITFDRPEVCNAVHYDVLVEMEQCVLSFR